MFYNIWPWCQSVFSW